MNEFVSLNEVHIPDDIQNLDVHHDSNDPNYPINLDDGNPKAEQEEEEKPELNIPDARGKRKGKNRQNVGITLN